MKEGGRYYLQRGVSCSDVYGRGRNHEPNQPNAQISDLVERPLACRVRVSAVPCEYYLSGNRGDLPRDSERDQSRKYPGRGAEQEGHSWVIPECSDGGGEEHVEGKGGDGTGQASRKG